MPYALVSTLPKCWANTTHFYHQLIVHLHKSNWFILSIHAETANSMKGAEHTLWSMRVKLSIAQLQSSLCPVLWDSLLADKRQKSWLRLVLTGMIMVFLVFCRLLSLRWSHFTSTVTERHFASCRRNPLATVYGLLEHLIIFSNYKHPWLAAMLPNDSVKQQTINRLFNIVCRKSIRRKLHLGHC